MARNYMDMTLVPSKDIRKIVEEALDGCYDTFNRVMEKYGFANGIPADDFVTKSAKNVLVGKRELNNAFLDLELEVEEAGKASDRKWVEQLVKRMMDKFIRIVSEREADIIRTTSSQIKDLDTKISGIGEDLSTLTTRHNDLETRHGSDMEITEIKFQGVNEGMSSLEARVKALEDRVAELSNTLTDIQFSIKLIQHGISEGGTQSHGVSCPEIG